ncbi:hypothetical protein [Pseudophaeobacter flagellatus]|uniref:hypothetical protein n=1 Tax=Pseudophaeobacter flagellatus TaxID=2899119 RepID=UPI001E3076FC|nr:hypothetical protein [Pseudophaeobacter flagellatus]MCD9149662.1 hypothetical protein [Pseudophaeobacter flagellatus]
MCADRVTGDEIRAMVREGTKRRTSFGFCLDDTKDALLMIQPGNKPEALRAPLKKAGGKPPMLWGTYVVQGDQMEMTCEQTSAKVLLQLKRFLKSNRPKVNVLFFDDGGNILDSLKPESASGATTPSSADSSDIDAPEIDPKAVLPLKQRMKRLQPRIALAPGPLELKLNRALAKSVTLINAGRLQEAEVLILVSERAIAALGKDREDEETTLKRGQRATDTRSLGEQVKRAQSLQADVARAPGPARDRLTRAIHKAAKLLKQRDLDGARDAMDKIEKALTSLV